jgi:hypothetical protein
MEQTDTYEDDNKLVTIKDLADPEVKTLWSDETILEQLKQEMDKLSKVRNSHNTVPQEIIVRALAEVLTELGWSDYATFLNSVNKVLNNPRNIPFSVRTKDIKTGKNDFWLMRIFINNGVYVDENRTYSKQNVLLSRQFAKYLRDFCKTELRDEVQFWTFAGKYNNNQHLDLSKLKPFELKLLQEIKGDIDANNLIMFQFKKKTPEVMVGNIA